MVQYDWMRAEKASPEPSLEGGSSGFFTPPSQHLDPDLFDGLTMRPEVREYILATLTGALKAMGLQGMERWLYLWVIGSSMSYQWGETSGYGDIDVTFAAEPQAFAAANPDWAGLPAADTATIVKHYIHLNVAPGAAQHVFGGHAYEVTFFWNPDIQHGDIGLIHPYAAYDVISDRFAVPPVELPPDPASLYPQAWAERAQQDTETAARLTRRHNALRRELEASPVGSPGYHNSGSQLALVAAQAQTFYDDIHLGRMLAFKPGGEGYGDWHNYRWQAAKGSGAAKALEGIIGISKTARDAADTELYGGPIASADEVLHRAMMVQQARS